MRSVGTELLKSKLNEYVRLAAGGETILVTDRDRVVAELVPPQPDRGELPVDRRSSDPWQTDPWLAGLVRQGAVRLATVSGQPPRGKPVMTLEEILRDQDDDRADR